MAARIAALACESGMDVTLAGRPSAHMAKLGHSLGVPCRTARLDNPRQLDAMLVGVQTVVNTAGPFTYTAPALMRACLRNGCNYLDLSNEAATFLDAWTLRQAAEKAGMAVVPGAGFGTAAAECLAAHVSARIHDPITLNIVRTSSHQAHTSGVKATMLELLITPGAGVRDGLWSARGFKTATFDLPEGRRTAIPIAVGDCFAAAKTTGIRNVTVYASTGVDPIVARIGIPIIRRLGGLGAPGLRRQPHNGNAAGARGPEPVHLWAQATDTHGGTATARIRGDNGGEATAQIALQAIRQIHISNPATVLTVGKLIGPKSILDLPGITITDL